jgi:hypothetical protein
MLRPTQPPLAELLCLDVESATTMIWQRIGSYLNFIQLRKTPTQPSPRDDNLIQLVVESATPLQLISFAVNTLMQLIGRINKGLDLLERIHSITPLEEDTQPNW